MRTLLRTLECRDLYGVSSYDYSRNQNYYNLLFNITFANRAPVLLTTQPGERNSLVAEWFEEGENHVNITVCRLQPPRLECNPTSIPVSVVFENVTVLVLHNTSKFFPYGDLTVDNSFRGINEGSTTLTPSDDVPFFEGSYRTIYVSRKSPL